MTEPALGASVSRTSYGHGPDYVDSVVQSAYWRIGHEYFWNRLALCMRCDRGSLCVARGRLARIGESGTDYMGIFVADERRKQHVLPGRQFAAAATSQSKAVVTDL
jgi:hypothetical protein